MIGVRPFIPDEFIVSRVSKAHRKVDHPGHGPFKEMDSNPNPSRRGLDHDQVSLLELMLRGGPGIDLGERFFFLELIVGERLVKKRRRRQPVAAQVDP